MAQCLLHHGWLVLLKTGACCGLPIFFEVTTNWRAGCQKLACPVRREGRPESSSLPLSRRTPTRRYADTPTRLFPGGAVDWRTINSGVNTIVCTGLAPRRRSSRSSIVHFPIVSIGWETTVKGGSI